MHYKNRSRRGFTLIELLVVISIIAILVALSSAAIQRVRVTQNIHNTESTVAKLQTGVDNQVKALAETVKKERRDRSIDFNKLLPLCDNDLDRTEALLMYIRLRTNLPYSLADTGVPTLTISVSINGGPLQPIFVTTQPTPYKALTNAPGIGGSGDADRVSAAFLYVALSQLTQMGNAFESDGSTSAAQLDINLNGVNCKTYIDAWRNPIGYRLASSTAGQPAGVIILPELASAPYAENGREIDPFDPLGKLATWTGPNAVKYKPALQSTLGVNFDGKNKRMVVYSAGVNQTYENFGGDDILGHRLISIGQRGSK